MWRREGRQNDQGGNCRGGEIAGWSLKVTDIGLEN
jgi:hypothetical protein